MFLASCSSSLFLALLIQVPLTTSNWLTVAAWALPILLVDEVLKAVGRSLSTNEEKAGSTSTKAI